ncbi:Glu/Leu/Phe/Val dehydrogenase [Candidatus Giovannonibacteria bacterium]|nr:Glu/Leu/Phe/Val dehydrogenase [Candidatus Giovannonibacteria bacterium]
MKIFDIMAERSITLLTILPGYGVLEEAKWITQKMREMGHEKVVLICYPDIKLKACIAIHDRTLGKHAIGGWRILPYESEEELISDALRLSQAMSFKASLAGLCRGGGKCTVWGDPMKGEKTVELMMKLAEAINILNGEYVTAEDMNVSARDILLMRTKTRFAVGLPSTFSDPETPAYKGSGDPSPVTALGIVHGMEAALDFLSGEVLRHKTVALQGVGHVGMPLAEYLYNKEVNVIACDTNPQRVSEFHRRFHQSSAPDWREYFKVVSAEDIYDQECDIFAPCTVGGVLNEKTIPRLKCKIVAGSANNVLCCDDCGKILFDRGILLAPDFVINAAGLINVDDELNHKGYNTMRVQDNIARIIPQNLKKIFFISRELKKPANEVAYALARARIRSKKHDQQLLKKELRIRGKTLSSLLDKAEEELGSSL